LAFAAASADADGLRRRDGQISSSGDSLCEVASVRETVPLVIDEWTYDFGRNRFAQLVGSSRASS
jgi:hypothetical protein